MQSGFLASCEKAEGLGTAGHNGQTRGWGLGQQQKPAPPNTLNYQAERLLHPEGALLEKTLMLRAALGNEITLTNEHSS